MPELTRPGAARGRGWPHFRAFTTNVVGDLAPTVTGGPTAAWVAGITDLNGDGLADFIFGAPGDDDKAPNAGRIFISLGAPILGNSGIPGTGSAGIITIDGVHAGDLAGTSVGSIADLNGDGRAEILVGAPGMDKGAALDAGAAFVLWGLGATGGIDLADPFTDADSAKGYAIKGNAIKGEAAGDAAGGVVLSVGDRNGDGLADVLAGAAGNDAGGSNAGAVYVVWGGNPGPVDRSLISQRIGGAKIGGAAGSLPGSTVAITAAANGDGVADLIIGAPGIGEGVKGLFTPTSWQPDHNIYGTNGNDLMTTGFGGSYKISAGADTIDGPWRQRHN